MKFITIAGPPSCGKTAVLIHTIKRLLEDDTKVAVGKIDCLETDDGERYKDLGIPVIVGLSGDLCPDHYYVSNLEEILCWARKSQAEMTILETAGLCHRCAPAIVGCLSVVVIDNLSGIDTPRKIGPVLTTADIVVITKGDIVSQAEREVFRQKIRLVNPEAEILEFNGLTGKGSVRLRKILLDSPEVQTLVDETLRSSMPASICSYCTGETRIGNSYQLGNVLKIIS
jgi:Ni2+-binding GTPase involved in maturation of urease and hydrogenase